MLGKDSEEGEGNGDRSRQVTLRGGEGIRSCCPFEEEQSKEDKDFCPDTRTVFSSLYAKGFEGGEDDEDCSPTVPQRERKVNPDFIMDRLGRVVFLYNIVDVGHSGRDKKGKDECPDIVAAAPKVDVNGIQYNEQRETPGNAVDNDMLARSEELVNDSSEKKEVDQSPDEESPRGRCDVCDGGTEIDVQGPRTIGVGAEEQTVDNNVDDFQKEIGRAHV